MNREDQLKWCRKCEHKKTDIQRGIVCGLTNELANFRDFCPDFEKSKEAINNEANRRDFEKREANFNNTREVKSVKNPALVTIGIVISVLFIGLRIARYMHRASKYDNNTQSQYNRPVQNNTKQNSKKYRANAVAFFKSKGRKETFYGRLEKDSVFQITDNIRLSMRKNFRMSTANENDELPVFAIFKPYYFAYNKLEKDPNKTLTNQWKDLRANYGYKNRNSTFNIVDTMQTYNNSVKYKFEYTNSNGAKIIGVAQLTEENNQRYFFQFSTNSDDVSYNTLIKYLGYYVNIK